MPIYSFLWKKYLHLLSGDIRRNSPLLLNTFPAENIRKSKILLPLLRGHLLHILQRFPIKCQLIQEGTDKTVSGTGSIHCLFVSARYACRCPAGIFLCSMTSLSVKHHGISQIKQVLQCILNLFFPGNEKELFIGQFQNITIRQKLLHCCAKFLLILPELWTQVGIKANDRPCFRGIFYSLFMCFLHRKIS